MTHVFLKQADINLDHSEKHSHFAQCMFFPTNYHLKTQGKESVWLCEQYGAEDP